MNTHIISKKKQPVQCWGAEGCSMKLKLRLVISSIPEHGTVYTSKFANFNLHPPNLSWFFFRPLTILLFIFITMIY